MKVLNLQCDFRHAFEGWFASEDDYQNQLSRQLVRCPLCGSDLVHKLPSAPRLNLSGDSMPVPTEESVTVQQMAGLPQAQRQVMQAIRELLVNTEDVGTRFAKEARKIHYGEAELRNIRGQASAKESAELAEEGIQVLPLTLPEALKNTLQ